MPTENPRVNVTLSPELYQMVGDLAQLQRASRSMVIRELLEASQPALSQVVAFMRAAQQLNDDAKKNLAADLEAAVIDAEQKASHALEAAAGLTDRVAAEADAIRGRRPGRKVAGEGEDPPPSNRGVKS